MNTNNESNEFKEWGEWDRKIWGGMGWKLLDAAVLPTIFVTSYGLVTAIATGVYVGGFSEEAQLAAGVGFVAMASFCIAKERMGKILHGRPRGVPAVVTAAVAQVQMEQIRSIAMIGVLAALGSVLVGGVAAKKIAGFAAFSIGAVRYFSP